MADSSSPIGGGSKSTPATTTDTPKTSTVSRLLHKTGEAVEKKKIDLKSRGIIQKVSWQECKNIEGFKQLIEAEAGSLALTEGLDSVSKSSTSNVTTPLKRILFHAVAWLSDALTGHSIVNLVKPEGGKLAESEKAGPLVRILSGVFFILSIPAVLIVAVATLPILPAGLPIKLYDLLKDSKHRKQIYNNILSATIELVFKDFKNIDGITEKDWQQLGKVVQEGMKKANTKYINSIKEINVEDKGENSQGKTLPEVMSEILATNIGNIAKKLPSDGDDSVAEKFKNQFLDTEGNLLKDQKDKLEDITATFSKHTTALAKL